MANVVRVSTVVGIWLAWLALRLGMFASQPSSTSSPLLPTEPNSISYNPVFIVVITILDIQHILRSIGTTPTKYIYGPAIGFLCGIGIFWIIWLYRRSLVAPEDVEDHVPESADGEQSLKDGRELSDGRPSCQVKDTPMPGSDVAAARMQYVGLTACGGS